MEKFVAHDLEIILGVKYDATFGPVVLCGLGGIFTEVLKDFALRLAPLTKSDAEEMLSSLKAYAGLEKNAEERRLARRRAAALCPILPWTLNGKIQAVDINPIGFGGDTGSSDRARCQSSYVKSIGDAMP